MVDDLIDTAGTLCEASKVLKEQGAKKVVAYITHPVLSGSAMEKIQSSQAYNLTNFVQKVSTQKQYTWSKNSGPETEGSNSLINI